VFKCGQYQIISSLLYMSVAYGAARWTHFSLLLIV